MEHGRAILNGCSSIHTLVFRVILSGFFESRLVYDCYRLVVSMFNGECSTRNWGSRTLNLDVLRHTAMMLLLLQLIHCSSFFATRRWSQGLNRSTLTSNAHTFIGIDRHMVLNCAILRLLLIRRQITRPSLKTPRGPCHSNERALSIVSHILVEVLSLIAGVVDVIGTDSDILGQNLIEEFVVVEVY